MTSIDELKQLIRDHEQRISKIENSQGQSRSRRSGSSRRKSITDLLEELKKEGFFKQPKLLSEIVDKLAEKSYHYSVTSLTEPLQRAVRSHTLGRLKKEKKWAYVAR